jgi:hypothetical protein
MDVPSRAERLTTCLASSVWSVMANRTSPSMAAFRASTSIYGSMRGEQPSTLRSERSSRSAGNVWMPFDRR